MSAVAPDMADEPKSVGEILDRIDEIAEDGNVSLGHVAETLGNRAHGPFLMIPAMIDVSPVGSIPGLPTVLAVVIVITAAQLLFGRKHLWLPGFLARRSISPEKARKATGKFRGIARFLDRWFHGRLPALTKGPFVRVAAALVILLACTVPPLELFPLATTAPMAAIAAFGLALLVRDGLLMLVASVLAIAAIALGLGLAGGKAGK